MPTESEKLKAVIDTNVFISGLNFTGKPSEVLELLMKGEIGVYISPFILEEVERILRERFSWSEGPVQKVLNRIGEKTIQPEVKVSIIKGKDNDNRILECAIEGKVQYLISGDKRHLLPLKEYQGIKILSPAEFLELL